MTPSHVYTVRMGQGWYTTLLARCREVGRVTDHVRWDSADTTTCAVCVRFRGSAGMLRRRLGFETWMEVR